MRQKSNSRFIQYLVPTIKALQELGYTARPKQVREVLEARLDVPEELETIHKSGQTRFENDVHWARLYLAKAGYIDASKRGVWSLTEKGKNAAINEDMAQSIFDEAVSEIKASKTQTDNKSNGLDDDDLEDIEEEIDEEIEHRGETLERLKELSPYGFERFCRALLLETGFEDVEMTGQSGDKGIDGNGTLRVNPFVTIKVMYQCKRYKDSVSSPQIRDFRGAITGMADRGLFITTGKFTREAEMEASRDGVTPIEMVDGSALVKLMEDFEFGLQSVRTFRLESEFFSRFEE